MIYHYIINSLFDYLNTFLYFCLMIKKLEYLQRILPTADQETILGEVSSLELQNSDGRYSELLQYIESGKRVEAANWLDAFLQGENQLSNKENISLDGLRTRMTMLEVQLSVLVNKIAELHHTAGEYRRMHFNEMNMVIARLLQLRKEVFFLKMEKDSTYQHDYETAKEDEQQYKSTPPPEQSVNNIQLNADEKALLQKRFRRASKLCHPDLVADKLKDEAERFFVSLSKAYILNDLDAVTRILTQLESGEIVFSKSSEVLSEYDIIKSSVVRLQSEVESRADELYNLENSALIKTICNIDEWELYFSSLRRRFEGEIILFEKELEELLS